jgi:hypothetical protein
MVHNVNKVTPFRASHFDTYLDEWRAGRANTGESGTKPKITLTPEHQKIVDGLAKIASQYGG